MVLGGGWGIDVRELEFGIFGIMLRRYSEISSVFALLWGDENEKTDLAWSRDCFSFASEWNSVVNK